MNRQQTPGTPRSSVIVLPLTPQRAKTTAAFPFSSPYTGKSPLLGNNDNINSAIDSPADRIELFERGVGKSDTDIRIPPVGCPINQMPFFDSTTGSKFVETMKRINTQMNRLNKLNDNIVDMNESLGAYLFGLYQNAWCVNMNENFTLERISKLEEARKLEKEIEELEKELDNVRRRRSLLRRQEERRKSTMPPPSIPRFNVRDRQKRVREVDRPARQVMESVPAKRRTFLRAGSKKPRHEQHGGLNLSFATKLRTALDTPDTSNDSSGDTSEVQTLNTIRRVQNARDRRPLQQKSVNRGNSWEVNHRKPFR
ncbi:hypothetical protein CANINC_002850 [Pichia inconspicua]|uniref:Uncharacterized protein n=1 Tax=Pichia inconspicua TaxID=52247 RepID=A0A4V4NFL6_9ASCO|nr:hypothetical protein CANINC_002850 [[Candida] inconspicua]